MNTQIGGLIDIKNSDRMVVQRGNNTTLGNVVFKRRIGSRSVYGVTFACHVIGYEHLPFACKVMDNNNDNNRELQTLINFETNGIVSVNMPLLITHTIKPAQIINKLKLSQFESNFIFVFNELADADLNMFLSTPPVRDEQVYYNMFVQVLLAISLFHTVGLHCDLHAGNILVHAHPVNPGVAEFWWYNISGVDYYLQNRGFMFVIWDFGRTNTCYNQNYDIYLIFDAIRGFLMDSYTPHHNMRYPRQLSTDITNVVLAGLPNQINQVYAPKLKGIFDSFVNHTIFTALPANGVLLNAAPFTWNVRDVRQRP